MAALFLIISSGVPGRMPPQNENLLVRDRWDTVNFLTDIEEITRTLKNNHEKRAGVLEKFGDVSMKRDFKTWVILLIFGLPIFLLRFIAAIYFANCGFNNDCSRRQPA